MLRQRASQQREVADAGSPPELPVTTPHEAQLPKANSALAGLPQDLCHAVVKGLLKYVLALCGGDSDADFIPVISKVSWGGRRVQREGEGRGKEREGEWEGGEERGDTYMYFIPEEGTILEGGGTQVGVWGGPIHL